MLTAFSHAALLLCGGMLLGLVVSKFGYEAFAVVIGALVALVLVCEWRAPSIRCSHEHEDAD